jgi:hypothetical protein
VSGYYYSREAGPEGQILTGEGAAPGLSLEALLERERPPLRAAMEIGSAIADVLCISAEDRAVHGDIRPAHVKVDERGTVSVEGFGVARRLTRAPEGHADQLPVDLYGLGIVLHSMLSSEPLGNMPKDPDGHDDEVVSRVLAMDFSKVQGKRWLEDVRKFLCQILAYVPEDRPLALDAANVLASVAGQCPGEGIETWAKRASAQKASSSPAPHSPYSLPPASALEEDLGGPVSVAFSGGAKKGPARQAPAAKGESTSFWTRDKIAAMLAEEDEEEPAMPSARAPRQMDPPRDPPDPTRSVGPTRAPVVAEPPPRAAPPAQPRASSPPPAEAPRASRSLPPEPPAPPPPPQRGAAASPFAGAQIERSSPVDDEPPAEKKGNGAMIAVVAVVLILLCGGVLALGGGGALLAMRSGDTTDAPAEKATDEKPKEKAPEDGKGDEAGSGDADGSGDAAGSGGAGSGEKPAAQATKTEATAPKATTTSTSTPKATTATSTKSSATKATKSTTAAPPKTAAATTTTAAPAPAPATSSYSVKFSTPGREGRLRCGDGQTAEFAGATTMSFSGTVTCLVQIDKGRGTVQVSKNATVTCSEDAGKVTCSGG